MVSKGKRSFGRKIACAAILVLGLVAGLWWWRGDEVMLRLFGSVSYRVDVPERTIDIRHGAEQRFDVMLDFHRGNASPNHHPRFYPRIEYHEWGVRVFLPPGLYPISRGQHVALQVLARPAGSDHTMDDEWQVVFSETFDGSTEAGPPQSVVVDMSNR